MRVENQRWVIGSRDIWHGTECFEHCLKLSMAVEADVPEALERVASHKESGGVKFRKTQGTEYEKLRNSQLAENLGSDFVELPDFSDSDQVVLWANSKKLVIAQAPFGSDFGDFDYKGRADLLVRSDYRLAYKVDGTLTAEPIPERSQDGKYCIWEIKHTSKSDSKGKEQNVDIYKYQLAMAYESFSKLGIASGSTCGIIFKEQEMTEFDPEEVLELTRVARDRMFMHLNEFGPHRKKALAVETWRCEKPSVCESAKCAYPDICAQVRHENDELHQIYNINHTHIPKLKSVGIDTVEKFLTEGGAGSGVAAEQLEKHLRWARVISTLRQTGDHTYEQFSGVFDDPGALPERTEADLFVDFEWYTPLNTRTNVYYMFGVLNRQGELKQFIAEDTSEEEAKFIDFLECIESAILSHPKMHFYVSNKTAEKTGIEKLGIRYSIDQARINAVLEHIFDVQEAARNSIAVSTGGFGLKEMEVFFPKDAAARLTDTTDGEDSMWQYHEYLAFTESGQVGQAEAILKDIAAYNGDDCRGTMRFYDWLATL